MDADLRDLYQEVILDHGRNPRNFGAPADANRDAEGLNPLCGDRIHVYLTVDEAGRLRDAGFEGKGCAISQAAASLMTEVVKGKSAAETRALAEAFLALVRGEPAPPAAVAEEDMERLQVLAGVSEFPMRVKCATLAWHTLSAAMNQAGVGPAPVTTE